MYVALGLCGCCYGFLIFLNTCNSSFFSSIYFSKRKCFIQHQNQSDVLIFVSFNLAFFHVAIRSCQFGLQSKRNRKKMRIKEMKSDHFRDFLLSVWVRAHSAYTPTKFGHLTKFHYCNRQLLFFFSVYAHAAFFSIFSTLNMYCAKKVECKCIAYHLFFSLEKKLLQYYRKSLFICFYTKTVKSNKY